MTTSAAPRRTMSHRRCLSVSTPHESANFIIILVPDLPTSDHGDGQRLVCTPTSIDVWFAHNDFGSPAFPLLQQLAHDIRRDPQGSQRDSVVCHSTSVWTKQ